MELRPKLVDDFIDVILTDLGFTVDPDTRARWKEKMLAKFVSHSIPLDPPLSYGTHAKAVVDAFLAKYPETEAAVEYVRFAARHVWPQAEILLSVNSDPESCHVCHEGQCLHIEVFGPDWLDDSEIATIQRNRFDELTVLSDEPNPYTVANREHLVMITREFGDPAEVLGGEDAYRVEWETRRRERAAQKAVDGA